MPAQLPDRKPPAPFMRRLGLLLVVLVLSAGIGLGSVWIVSSGSLGAASTVSPCPSLRELVRSLP